MENGDANAPNAALDAAADEIIASDPSLLALKASLSQKKAALLDQLAGMTASHPLRKTTEEQLSEIEQALQQMQANLRAMPQLTWNRSYALTWFVPARLSLNCFPI